MKRSLLLPALLVQAALLLPNLGLLPVWGDEQFTLSTIVLPIDRMLEAVGADVHPPLYYLVNHFWLRLPLPGSEIVRVRFLSVMVCLLGTIAAYLIWVRPLKPGLRAWFLALWVLSPFLLLYARMGRSYSMQLLFACLALGYGIDAGSRRNLLLYILWATILLYTHYLPGIAVTVAVSVQGELARVDAEAPLRQHGPQVVEGLEERRAVGAEDVRELGDPDRRVRRSLERLRIPGRHLG